MDTWMGILHSNTIPPRVSSDSSKWAWSRAEKSTDLRGRQRLRSRLISGQLAGFPMIQGGRGRTDPRQALRTEPQ